MGQEKSKKWPRLMNKYEFVQNIKDSPFGVASIYRKKQLNYDYLIMITRQIMPRLAEEIERQFAFLTGQRSYLPFLKVYHVFRENAGKEESFKKTKKYGDQVSVFEKCTGNYDKNQSVNVCLEYLTFSLREHLQYKHQTKSQLSLAEYVYIIRTAIYAAQLYEKWNLTYLQLMIKSDFIYLNPQGEVKIIPFQSRFLTEQKQQCCGENLCAKTNGSCRHSYGRAQLHTYSGNMKKNIQKKYVKQIKLLSMQLLGTINPDYNQIRNNSSNFSSNFILSTKEHQNMVDVQCKINNAKTLQDLTMAMEGIEDNFINIKINSKVSRIQNSLLSSIGNYNNYEQETLIKKLNILSQSKEKVPMNLENYNSQNITVNLLSGNDITQTDSTLSIRRNSHKYSNEVQFHKTSYGIIGNKNLMSSDIRLK